MAEYFPSRYKALGSILPAPQNKQKIKKCHMNQIHCTTIGSLKTSFIQFPWVGHYGMNGVSLGPATERCSIHTSVVRDIYANYVRVASHVHQHTFMKGNKDQGTPSEVFPLDRIWKQSTNLASSCVVGN